MQPEDTGLWFLGLMIVMLVGVAGLAAALDSDGDGVDDANDLCPGTPPLTHSRAVDADGCPTKDIIIQTDGPLWQFDNEVVGTVRLSRPYVPGPYVFECSLVAGPGGGQANRLLFGRVGTEDAVVWFRAYTDGTCQLWDRADVEYWQNVHATGSCPWGDANDAVVGHWFDYHPHGHPTTTTVITVDEGAPPSAPASFRALAAEDGDSDVDGVPDVIDLCPDSDPNVALIDDDGCPLPPACGDPWHQPPGADIDADCYVDANDVIALAQEWLDCTDPLGESCVQLQPSPDQMYPEMMYMRQCWPKTVDGLLGDWVDPYWVDLDLVYWGDPCDVSSAKYTPCWDPCNDMVYAAVVVEDNDHVFETGPTAWNSSDRIEVYYQGDPNGGDKWGSQDTGNHDKAQQVSVGYQLILPGWAWAMLGERYPTPGGEELPWPEFDYRFGTRVGGNIITYEIGAKMYVWYGGNTLPIGSVGDEVRQLGPGMQIGFDVVVGSRWGGLPHDDDEWGMLSANLNTDKYIFADQFQRWELVNYDVTKVDLECGDWGYLVGDITTPPDCYVDLGDMAAQAIQWMDCTDPDPPCSFEW